MNPRTLATTVRCDARDAAMALHLLDSQGVRITSVSDLFRESIALVAQLAVHQGLVPKIESTQEAIHYLHRMKIVDLLKEGRPETNAILAALTKETPRQVPSTITQAQVDAIRQSADPNSGGIALKDFIPEDVVEDEE